MSQTRIIRIPLSASQPAPFLIVDDQGRVLQRGALTLEDPGPSLDVRTVAITPGADVLVRWLDLPVGGAAQVRAAARWMLKDQLAGDPDRMAVALGAAASEPGGARLVAAVSASLLEAWVDYLAAMGVTTQAMVPDSLTPPAPQDAETLNGLSFGGDIALRGERFAATVQSDLVAAVAGARPVAVIENPADIDALLANAALNPAVNLLGGVEKGGREAAGDWRLAVGLATALLVSPLVLTLAGALRDQAAADHARKTTLALIEQRLPQAATAPDPVAEVMRRAAAAPPPGGVTAASAALFAAVEQVEGAELDGLSADANQGLRATVSYPAFQDLETMKTAVGAFGLSLSDTSTEEDGGRVVSEVVVGGPA